MKYKVHIEETYRAIYEVEASSEEEDEQLVSDFYYNGNSPSSNTFVEWNILKTEEAK